MDNLPPQSLGVDCLPDSQFLLFFFIVAVAHGELLHILTIGSGGLHEGVVNLHAYIGTRHFAFGHLGIDESLCIRMLDAYRKHQRTTATVLGHLARTITITLHKGNQSRGSQRRIVHRTSFRTDMTQVMPYSTAALHQLHLLLIDTHHGTIGIGIAVQADYETVRQRSHLITVADTRHGRAGRYDIAEMIQQFENLLLRQRVLILLFDAGHLTGNTPVHILRTLLIDIAVAVLHGIFVHPHAGGKLVAVEIF